MRLLKKRSSFIKKFPALLLILLFDEFEETLLQGKG